MILAFGNEERQEVIDIWIQRYAADPLLLTGSDSMLFKRGFESLLFKNKPFPLTPNPVNGIGRFQISEFLREPLAPLGFLDQTLAVFLGLGFISLD